MNETPYIMSPERMLGDCVCESLLIIKNTQYYKTTQSRLECLCQASTALQLLKKCQGLGLSEFSTYPYVLQRWVRQIL